MSHESEEERKEVVIQSRAKWKRNGQEKRQSRVLPKDEDAPPEDKAGVLPFVIANCLPSRSL
jgi:hypothetical protein